MELLATVHWVLKRERATDDTAIARAVHAWGPNKRQFTERQIHLTVRHLTELGWR